MLNHELKIVDVQPPISELALSGLHDSIKAGYLDNERAKKIFEHYFPEVEFVEVEPDA